MGVGSWRQNEEQKELDGHEGTVRQTLESEACREQRNDAGTSSQQTG